MSAVDEIVYVKSSVRKTMDILEESNKEIEEAIDEIQKALNELKTVQSPQTIRRLEYTVGDINPTKYALLCEETIETTISNMEKSIASVEEYLADSTKEFPEIKPMEGVRFVTLPIIPEEENIQEKEEEEILDSKETVDTEESQSYNIKVPTQNTTPQPAQQQPAQQAPEAQYQPTEPTPEPVTEPPTVPETEPITEPETIPTTVPMIQPVIPINGDMNNIDWRSPEVLDVQEQKSAQTKNFAPIVAGAGVAAAAVGVTGAVIHQKHKEEEEEEQAALARLRAKQAQSYPETVVRYNVVETVEATDDSQNYDVRNNQVIAASQEFKYN